MSDNVPSKGPDIRPVAHGTRKQAGLDKKLRSVFINDSASSVGDYLVWDILVPGVKGIITQALHGFVDGVFGGSGRSYRGSSYRYDGGPSYRYGRTDYSGRSRERSERSYGRRRDVDDDIVLESRVEAEDVRDQLSDIVEQYGCATLSQYHSMTQTSDRDFTDANWGWYDISRTTVRVLRDYFGPGEDGFVLDLPRPVYLKD